MIKLMNQSTVAVILRLFFDDPSVITEITINPDETKTVTSLVRATRVDIGTAYFRWRDFYTGPVKSFERLTGKDCYRVSGHWIIHIDPVPCHLKTTDF